MKIFRWSGLIGFVIFTGLLAGIGLLFLDGWTKKAVEAAGFSVNGAEVTVRDVDLTLSPLGFRFEQVAVADADNPMQNAVEIGQMRLAINFPQLFLGNVRLQDVTIADVRTRTPREQPARVIDKPEVADGEEDSGVTAIAGQQAERIAGALPTPGEAVDQQTQNTQQAVTGAQQTIADAREDIAVAADQVPGDNELDAYRDRIAQIKARELNSLEAVRTTQQQVTELAKEVAQDKLAIESLKREIESSVQQTQDAVADVTAAPAEDWAQLKRDYPLNQESAMKVARLLIGDSVFDTYDQASYWYNKAKPWIQRLAPQGRDEPEIERLEGRFVRFPHPDPTARFQLDKGRVSFEADSWPWELTVEDLTSHRGDLYVPTQIRLQRGTDDQLGLRVTGRLDRVDGQSVDRLDIVGQGVAFASRSVNLADVRLDWTPSPADVSGDLVVTDGELDGQISLAFPESQFDVSGEGITSRYLRDALSAIDAFTMDVNIGGRIGQPELSIASNLDNQLGDALRDVARAEYDAWLADVRAQLDARVAELRAPVDDAAASVRRQRDEVIERIDTFENDVEAEIRSLESKVTSERERLENQAADRLKAEREKAEAAARKEAEDKLKEEADKLKDQFSF